MTIGKVKSHLFRIVLSVVIAVCASAFAVAKNVTVDNIVYKINTSTGTATVTGPVEGKHPSNVTIRKTVTSGIENYTVTKIDASAFCYLQLKSITLPATIETIGSNAFKGSSLTAIALPKNLRIIGKSAFDNTDITEITIPASVEIIRAEAFLFSKLKKVNFAANGRLDEIGDNAFAYCALEEVTLPVSLTKLGVEAFYRNETLKKVTYLASKVPTIPTRCFARSKVTATVSICEGVHTIGEEAFYDCRVVNLSLPKSSLRVIGEGAFVGSHVVNLVIPEGVHTIGDRAFHGSIVDYMESLDLPSTLQSIGVRAFFDNDKLRSVVVRSATPPAYGNEAFESAVEYYADLSVVPYAVDAYKAAAGWKNWRFIDAIGTGGVDSVEAEGSRILSVDISGRAFTIDGAEGRQVSVFDVRGVEVARFASYRGEEVSLPGGVYLVSACGASVKVAL